MDIWNNWEIWKIWNNSFEFTASWWYCFSPLASLLTSAQYIYMVKMSQLNKQVNMKFAIDPGPPSFLLYLTLKLLDSSHSFPFWSLICSSSTVGWLFTNLSPLKLLLPESPVFKFPSLVSFFLIFFLLRLLLGTRLFSLSLKCRSFPRFGFYLALLLSYAFSGQSGPHAQGFSYCLYLLLSDTY